MMDWVLLLIGAAIGWAISHVYYYIGKRDAQAADEQRRQFEEEQRRFLTTIAMAAEKQGLVKLTRDGNGRINGGQLFEVKASLAELKIKPLAATIRVTPAPGADGSSESPGQS